MVRDPVVELKDLSIIVTSVKEAVSVRSFFMNVQSNAFLTQPYVTDVSGQVYFLSFINKENGKILELKTGFVHFFVFYVFIN